MAIMSMTSWLLILYLFVVDCLIMPTKRPAAALRGRPAARIKGSSTTSPAAAKSPVRTSRVAAAQADASSASGVMKKSTGKKPKLPPKPAVVAPARFEDLEEELRCGFSQARIRAHRCGFSQARTRRTGSGHSGFTLDALAGRGYLELEGHSLLLDCPGHEEWTTKSVWKAS